MKSILFALFVLLSFASCGHATTYIVDNQNPRAADTNAGTREQPLKTIDAAAQKAQAGDEVLVRAGTYREAVTLRNSGKMGQPIVFRSEVSHAAIVSGSDILSAWKAEGPGVWSAAAPGIKLETRGRANIGNGEWIYVNDYPLQRATTKEQLAPGSFWHEFDKERVWVMPEEGQDIKDLKVEHARRDGLLRAEGALDDIHIIGFTVVHNASWMRGRPSIGIVGRRWLVENNRVLWSSYLGIGMSRTNGAVVRNNLVAWNGDQGLGGGGSTNMLVEGNKIFHNNWRRISPNFEGGATKFVSIYNSRIRNNEVAYNYGYGLWTDSFNYGNITEGNVCHDNLMGATLFTEIDYGNIIRDNVTFNNENGITVGESPNSLVLRNIVFNNSSGIRVRGNFRRNNSHDPTLTPGDSYDNYLAQLKRIPDMDEMEIEQHLARYLLIQQAPKYWISNNSYIKENIVFDNGTNYFEHRNYAERSEIDPFINNFSDYNIWWHSSPERNFQHAAGRYNDFDTWRKVSGRDARSVYANPRDAKTTLPEWALNKRHYWEQKYRTPAEMNALKLGYIESPMTAELASRIRRAAAVRPLALSDGQVKAFQFDVDGQPIVAMWTSQLADRRYVRLNVDTANVIIENGFGGRQERKLSNSTVDLVATYTPTYVRGVGQNVREVPGSTVSARSFNAPNRPVPVKAVFINDSKTVQTLSAKLSATQGYRMEPAQVTRRMKPGQKIEIALSAVPSASFVGNGRVALDATLGSERILRSATFAVGEGGARLVTAARPPVIDGKLDDWQALGEPSLLGAIADAAQITSGAQSVWKGPNDAGGKIYATWTKDAIYAAVAVTDDMVVGSPPGADPYNNDATEFFLDARASDMQWQIQPTEGVVHLAIGPSVTGQTVVRDMSKAPLQGLQTALGRTADGYVVEIRIPLTAENFPARDWNVGRTVKMSVLLNDKDGATTAERENVLGWSASPSGRNFADTSGWKVLVLE